MSYSRHKGQASGTGQSPRAGDDDGFRHVEQERDLTPNDDSDLEPSNNLSKSSEELTYRELFLQPIDKVIERRDAFGHIDASKLSSVFRASYKYSISQVKREKQTICIGASTVTLIVFISAMICVFLQNNLTLFYLMGLD